MAEDAPLRTSALCLAHTHHPTVSTTSPNSEATGCRKLGPILQVRGGPNDIASLQVAFEQAQIPNPIYVMRDGQEAIHCLADLSRRSDRSLHPLPCLILLDLKKPIKSGLEVLQWLRQQSGMPPIPVIVFSSALQESDVLRCYQLGADAVVAKPVSTIQRTRLARVIKEFWLHFPLPAPDASTAAV